MWLLLTVLLAVCAHLQHAQVPGLVSKPSIEDFSTKEHVILLCNSATPDVTYTWLDRKEEPVGSQQIYRVYRPKEDLTLTCLVENLVSVSNASITIPYFPDCSGLGGGDIAAIVLGVFFGLLLLVNILLCCLCCKSLKAVRSLFSCFDGEDEGDAEKGEKMDQLGNKTEGGSSSEDEEDNKEQREMLDKRAEAQ